jgi:uncharacterized protein YdhG (YjbR/CyaY superfamily)
MRSKATTVEAYIAEAEPERRAALEKLRTLCRARFPQHAEEIRWGVPAYSRGEEFVVGFASQKQYVALYVGEAALDANASALGKLDRGKGCLRFRNPAAIDYGLVEKLLASCERAGGAC